ELHSDLFQQAGLVPAEREFLTRRASCDGELYCGSILTALLVHESPNTSKAALLERHMRWLAEPDHERTLLSHPFVVDLARNRYSLPYLDGVIVGSATLPPQQGSGPWLVNGQDSDLALDFVVGVLDGRRARRMFGPRI